MSILEIKRLRKNYGKNEEIPVLKKIDLEVEKGEFVAIMGPSGSGKTTLLNCIGTIDSPTNGEILYNGHNPFLDKNTKLTTFRRRQLGFVFQNFKLLSTLDVKENIMLPLALDDVAPRIARKKAEHLMKKLDILSLKDARTHELSGGQQQRVAIARALIHQPQLVLADEPTGNLDSKSAEDVMTLFTQLNKEKETTTLMVTHDPVCASYASRVIFIRDGQFYNELYAKDNQQDFYQSILTVLSHLGGRRHDFLTRR